MCGVARDVEVHIGKWKSKETIDVIPLNDYDFVIGLGFLNMIYALVVPFVDSICMLNTHGQCVVSMKRDSGRDGKMLSAMQVSTGAKKER